MIKYITVPLHNKLKEACWAYNPCTIFETSIFNRQCGGGGEVVAQSFPIVLHRFPLFHKGGGSDVLYVWVQGIGTT